ncbi:MAG: UDP-N-acetylmuramate:L-alanyl-gamma-D-glutamyl-meso-diaminopimelate ligase, partial [Woeseiaceae bacterium]|nr:UDP-N-acetylmuramate:L-alanyl-gamma-D-glutamyl-meso-diaminopimelate ligase [Woeseiaceae bacterium]
CSARLTASKFFVIEGDEYDSAFFDKRPKFIHYHPKICIINNIEFDHADIYKDLKEITFQFHQLIRLVPSNGKIIYNGNDKNTADLIDFGHWCNTESYGSHSNSEWKVDFGSRDNIEIYHNDIDHYSSDWLLKGSYNKQNALSAIIAANTIGISPDKSLDSLKRFSGVKRRFELLGNFNGLVIYDDFAHHPTSIKKTLDDIAELYPDKIVSVSIELRSNTMRRGIHNDHLLRFMKPLKHVTFLSSTEIVSKIRRHADFDDETMHVFDSPNNLASYLLSKFNSDVVHVFLSNGDFMGAKEQVMSKLRTK